MNLNFVIGTRAELIKLFPLIKAGKEKGNNIKIVATGQHDLDNLCGTLGIPCPDIYLTEKSSDSSKFNGSIFLALAWFVRTVIKLRKYVDKETDFVLYHGDTMSTALSAIGTSKALIPFRKFRKVHVEAGLRSGNIFEPFPEEISRIIVDWFSDINFVPSQEAKKNIRYLSILKDVVTVGNTIQDSVSSMISTEDIIQEEYGVITVHRHENITNKKRLKKIVSILEKTDMKFYFPMHDNTKKALIKEELYSRLNKNPDIQIMDLIPYPKFVNLMSNAKLLMTDGGSIQEESVILGVPCVILREQTERENEIKKKFNYLSKFEVEKTVEFINDVKEGKYEKNKNLMEDGEGPSEKILRFLENKL